MAEDDPNITVDAAGRPVGDFGNVRVTSVGEVAAPPPALRLYRSPFVRGEWHRAFAWWPTRVGERWLWLRAYERQHVATLFGFITLRRQPRGR